jgi:acyl-CoA thioesterase
MAFGRMFDRRGVLLADIVQEGLMAYRCAAQLATR